MFKHKSEDYKITAVKYYLENDTNYTKTCEIFKCSERSLKRWIKRYEELEEIKITKYISKNNLTFYCSSLYSLSGTSLFDLGRLLGHLLAGYP